MWRSLIQNNEGQITDALDVSSLAKITDGYTPGHIQTAVTNVLSERRIQQVCVRVITAVETMHIAKAMLC